MRNEKQGGIADCVVAITAVFGLVGTANLSRKKSEVDGVATRSPY